jgi:hypothetical protein
MKVKRGINMQEEEKIDAPVAPPAPAAQAQPTPALKTEDDYNYIRRSEVIKFFKARDIRATDDAKEKLFEHLRACVQKELERAIDQLPKLSKGEHMGELKRKTLAAEDIAHLK